MKDSNHWSYKVAVRNRHLAGGINLNNTIELIAIYIVDIHFRSLGDLFLLYQIKIIKWIRRPQ